ncbi:MAG: hypothetical protein Ta2B_08700 [Termitinemataceae bacterium]|nr:MAG: hypothetical protein Ta2B_08700 [Termitinemataceae bacterium]
MFNTLCYAPEARTRDVEHAEGIINPTARIKIIHDDNISTDTCKKARGAFVLIDNNAEIRLSSKADAQTYIHEKYTLLHGH